jgi:hypothetical protein
MVALGTFAMPDDVQPQPAPNQAQNTQPLNAALADPAAVYPPPLDANEVEAATEFVENGPSESDSTSPLIWEASEYVHHQKSPLWYGVVGLVVIILCALAIWLNLWLEIGVFIVAGIAVIVYASKPPRTLTYELSEAGIVIDGRMHPFAEFRSFGVVQDAEWHSLDLEPVKRFSPRLVLLFDDEDVEVLTDHLEQYLPREDHDPDVVERITRYVRF